MASNSDNLYLHIIKRNDYFELTALSEDRQLWYNLPDEHKTLTSHKILCSKQIVKKAMKGIKPINGFRKFCIPIDDELRKEYFDDYGNLSYLNELLEESNFGNEPVADKSNETEFFIKKIMELEAKLNSHSKSKLQDIEKKFILEKFDKRQNAKDWLKKFEGECLRHGIFDDTNMIEALRYFISGSADDWYKANITKFGLDTWSDWKASFLTVFTGKSWKIVNTAHNYKYIGGSLIDYALAKERLCLEAEENTPTILRINMIVAGLPSQIQSKLDREEITTMEKLFKEIRKLDESIFIKPRYRNNSLDKEIPNKTKNNIDTKTTSENQKSQHKEHSSNNKTFIQAEKNTKKPCFICEKLGFKNRYHPISECRNRNASTDEDRKMMNIEIDEQSLN